MSGDSLVQAVAQAVDTLGLATADQLVRQLRAAGLEGRDGGRVRVLRALRRLVARGAVAEVAVHARRLLLTRPRRGAVGPAPVLTLRAFARAPSASLSNIEPVGATTIGSLGLRAADAYHGVVAVEGALQVAAAYRATITRVQHAEALRRAAVGARAGHALDLCLPDARVHLVTADGAERWVDVEVVSLHYARAALVRKRALPPETIFVAPDPRTAARAALVLQRPVALATPRG